MKYLILTFALLFVLTGCSNSEHPQENSDYNTQKTSTQNDTQNSTSSTNDEEELSSFTTTIYTKTESRQNNVSLACQELSSIIVGSGETFSFCDTLGPAKPSEGYQKADTFDADGDIFQEYGGGKCQVSSTLYNAVLQVDGLEIVERHSHSSDVPYVEEGKDAAVSYGSVDFKFKNNNSFPVKIVAQANPDNVIIQILKINS